MDLVRRKAREFPLPGYIEGHLNRVFDKLTGVWKKNEVEFGPKLTITAVESEDDGSDNAEQTTKDTKV